MTKPMAVGSIKEKSPSWIEFNLLMEKLSLDDPIVIYLLLTLNLNMKKPRIAKLCTMRYFHLSQTNKQESKQMKIFFNL